MVELTTGDTASAQCGGELHWLGVDVTEELEYVPGRFIVNRIVRPWMACSGCDCFTRAPPPSRPIKRGRPSPGFFAHVLVNKYADHLPLCRQGQIFDRDGLDLDRSTLGDWVGKSTALLAPLADAIGRHMLAGQVIFVDDTPVAMLARAPARPKPPTFGFTGATSAPGGAPSHPAASTASHRTAKANTRKIIWRDTAADACRRLCRVRRPVSLQRYSRSRLYDHVRRKFVEVHKAQGLAIADEAIWRIAELYAAEKAARGLPPDKRAEIKRADARPDGLEAWLNA